MQGDGQQTPVPGQQPDGQWQYKPQESVPATVPAPVNTELAPAFEASAPVAAEHGSHGPDQVSWTASEYVAHHKTASWYAIFVAAAVVITVILYLVTKDWLSVGAVVIMVIIFGAAAVRKPNTLTYHVDLKGLTIGQRFYAYGEFRSFSIVNEGAFSSLSFAPFKRFMPPISVYYDPADEEKVVTVLSQHLPLEPASNDPIDRLARHLHF